MRVSKKVREEIESEVTEDIICNKCGESCKLVEECILGRPVFGGLLEVTVDGEYFSKAFSDGCSYTFSVCEKCLNEFFGTFKIEPDITEYM